MQKQWYYCEIKLTWQVSPWGRRQYSQLTIPGHKDRASSDLPPLLSHIYIVFFEDGGKKFQLM